MVNTVHRNAAAELINKRPRIMGACLLFIGGGALYTGVIKPVQDATEGMHDISISDRMAIVAVVGIILGLALLIGGRRVARLTHPAPGESRVWAIVFAIIMLGGGLGAYYGMKAYIEGLGYVFNGR